MRLHLRTHLMLIVGLVPSLAASDVYRCLDQSGTVVFTDVHCPGGRMVMEAVAASGTPPVGLRPGELERLRRLEARERARDHERQRAERARQRHLATERRRERRARAARCTQAAAALEALADHKRRGYRLADAGALAEQERRLEARLDDC